MMQEDKGRCKHGEFILTEGCPQCLAERWAEQKPETSIVKVKYYSETTGELSAREYTYYSADRLSVGDIVIVPVRDTTGKAKVSTIDVPEMEIQSFKDKVKTIPAGSVILTDKTIEQMEQEADESMDAMEKEIDAAADAQCAEVEAATFPAAETALAISPGADVEVLDYYNEALKLQEYAENRVIATFEDVKLATDDLALISKLKNVMENKRKAVLFPLQDQVKAINETYKTLMAPVLEADRITRDKLLTYDREQKRIRQEQEEINRKRMEAAEAEMRLKGEITEPVNLVEVVPEAPKRVYTDMGTAGQRDNWKYEVIDFALLPDEYKVVDTAMLNSIAKKHHDRKQIPGIRFYNEPIITMKAR